MYGTMNGAKMAFRQPMKMNLRCNLKIEVRRGHEIMNVATYPSISLARCLRFRNTFMTLPS